MKSLMLQTLYTVCLVVVCATATWFIRGGVRRELPCAEETLLANQVCLHTLEASGGLDAVLWIDARSRKDYRRGHMDGAYLLTTHHEENWDDLLAEVAAQLIEAPKVVVYCNSEKCGSSEEVVTRILESGLAGGEVYALYGGWQALQGAGKVPMH